MNSSLRKIRSIANYQFGKNAGITLFPEETEILFSRTTGRIRFVKLNGKRLATLRPTDGLFSISILAGLLLIEKRKMFRCFVNVQNDVTDPIVSGGDVFAVHVVKADEEIRAQNEVIILDEKNKVLAVGRALLSGSEMLALKTGVAVKVRHGRKES
ncbi:pseudouridine synthase [Candidatus Bathyarchaeota archaeon]|nr:pseudouridine synthase [Candidatus Bathyarchaeota archaeon]MCJ7713941.1 pseudouridine synthase [Candidatus Bathyarchaeota archaeon]